VSESGGDRLYVLALDGSHRPVGSAGTFRSVHWSPIGDAIVAIAATTKRDRIWQANRVVRVELSPATMRFLTPTAGHWASPRYSTADSGLVAAIELRLNGRSRLCLIRTNAMGEQRPVKAVSPAALGVHSYVWAPDGKALAFAAKPSGLVEQADGHSVSDLYTLDLATGVVSQVTYGYAVQDRQYCWTPDPPRLVFAGRSPRPGLYETQLLDPGREGWGAAVTEALATELPPFSVAGWRPDGRAALLLAPAQTARLWERGGGTTDLGYAMDGGAWSRGGTQLAYYEYSASGSRKLYVASAARPEVPRLLWELN